MTTKKQYPQEWNIWYGIKYRCGNPKFPKYLNLDYDSRWELFENFLSDMGTRPSPRHSIDRIDNTAGYSPQNCRWATQSEQNRNKDFWFRAAYPDYDEYWEKAKQKGIPGNTWNYRIRRGLTPKQAYELVDGRRRLPRSDADE